jgi:hypothetical protein
MTLFQAVNVREGVSIHTLPDINIKCSSSEDCECYAGHSTSRHGKCTWEMAAMP